MRSVESEVAKPGRSFIGDRNGDLHYVVLIAARLPFPDAVVEVLSKRVLVAFPHEDGGMIAPCLTAFPKRPQDLERFDSLLAEPLAVKALHRLSEARIREKGLHYALAFWSAARVSLLALP